MERIHPHLFERFSTTEVNRSVYWRCKRGIRRIRPEAVLNILKKCGVERKSEKVYMTVIAEVLKLCLVKIAPDLI